MKAIAAAVDSSVVGSVLNKLNAFALPLSSFTSSSPLPLLM